MPDIVFILVIVFTTLATCSMLWVINKLVCNRRKYRPLVDLYVPEESPPGIYIEET